MARKAVSSRQQIGRVGQRRQVVIPREIFDSLKLQAGNLVAFSMRDNGVLIKPQRAVASDEILTREESALITKARREMRQGEFVTLAQLEHDLARKRPSRRRKTA